MGKGGRLSESFETELSLTGRWAGASSARLRDQGHSEVVTRSRLFVFQSDGSDGRDHCDCCEERKNDRKQGSESAVAATPKLEVVRPSCVFSPK